MFALAFGVSSAGAVVAKIGGHTYGVTPINGVNAAGLAGVKRAQRASGVTPTSPLPYDKGGQLVSHGGPVMHSVTTHVIYWDPSGSFTAKTKEIVHKFFTDVAHDSGLATNAFGVAGQYNDSSGHALYSSTFETEATDGNSYGANTCTIPNQGDKSAFYTNCISDEKLQTELSAYITKEGLPTGLTQQYIVLFPHKVVTCLPEETVEVEPGVFVKIHPCSNNFYCAYHSSIEVEGGTANEDIIYSDIPFSLLDSEFAKDCQADGNGVIQNPNGDTTGTDEITRFADVALKYTSHEYIEAGTDPLGNGWWENANGQEIGDKCNFTGSGSELGEDPNAFLPKLGGSAAEGTLFNQSINVDHYYLQSEWDNAGKACLMKPLAITGAGFTPTAESTLVGSTVNFNASATDPYGHLSFAWDFGDGETGNGPSPSHEYTAPGKYTVTMTPTDELTGSTATPVQHTVTVKSTQTISFTSIAPGSATVGGPTYTVAAAASSGLPVSFSSGTPSVCAVAGSVVSFVGAGTCTIDADQAGNAAFEAALRAQQSFVVAKKSQTILFTSIAPGSATVGGPTYTVAAAASSGLPVSFSSGTPSVCAVAGSVVSFVGAGTCTIDADQAGNAAFEAAPQVQQSFAVGVALTPALEVVSTKEALTPPVPAPDSTFALLGAASVNAKTGAVTFRLSVNDPGTLSWVLTFANGRFGVFAAKIAHCKNGRIRLGGRCLPASIVFAKGSRVVSAPGAVTLTVKPSAAGLKALKSARKQKKGLPVTATLTFRASAGGAPVAHAQSLVVNPTKLK
jgi:PKD repeat protein